MRRLLLARHAKSSWGNPALTDHDRPLNARGYRAAQLVGAALNALGCVPDVVFSSTATRTRETWTQMEPHFDGHPRVEYHRGLYLAAPRTVLAAIADGPAEAETIMVLGHNPYTHALAAYLSRKGDPREIDLLRTKFPTGAVAVVDLSSDSWADADRGGELKHFILPRRLE